MNKVLPEYPQTSDNILKLRELVTKLDNDELNIVSGDCKKVINKLKELIVSERNRIAMTNSMNNKIKNYELLIMKVTTLLNEINFK